VVSLLNQRTIKKSYVLSLSKDLLFIELTISYQIRLRMSREMRGIMGIKRELWGIMRENGGNV